MKMQFFANINTWSTIKKIVFLPVMLVGLCLIGYLLLVLSYCIPTDRMETSMRESAQIFADEGSYKILMDRDDAQLDNFTDAIMLLTASHPRTESVWNAAIHATRYYALDKDSAQTVRYLYQDENAQGYDIDYSRYWHGYLFFLKPLLACFGYGTIRYILMIVQLGLFTLLIAKLSRRNRKLILPTFLVWIFLNPAATMLSLQFNSVIVVTFLAMLLIVCIDERQRERSLYAWGLVFILVGAATSYLDLLTFPLVTLGLPLVLWLALNPSDSLKENLLRILALSVCWAIGYFGMWCLKWLLGSLITGGNVLSRALEAAQLRTSTECNEQAVDFFSVLGRQTGALHRTMWKAVGVLMAAVFVWKAVRARRLTPKLLVPLAVIALYPFAWYFVFQNHSYIHRFFTYRLLAITLYAGCTFVMLYQGADQNE